MWSPSLSLLFVTEWRTLNLCLKYFCLIYGVTFSRETLSILKSYHWPGNIRELKNTVERAKALFPSEALDKEKILMILDGLEKENKKKEDPLWLLEKKSINETPRGKPRGIGLASPVIG